MLARSKFTITPPLLNSSCPWSTTLEEIKALYDSPYTGAVTTRTSLLEGFTHNASTHQHIFFRAGSVLDASTMHAESITITTDPETHVTSTPKSLNPSLAIPGLSSLNTYGYSPLTLSEYLGHINEIVGQRHLGTSIDVPKKPFILSVTGTPDEVAMAYALVANAAEMDEDLRLAVEVNLSCPNIHGRPPPAYERAGLTEYLVALADSMSTYRGRMASEECVPRVGVKLPPYTYQGQFEMVVECLREVKGGGDEGTQLGSVVDFVTCTNTLGSSLVLDDETGEAVLKSESGLGMGGLAGAALHPLALGNVRMFRKLLDQYPETEGIMVIGVGGVEDKAGFERMVKVGAGAVACASALGRYGIEVFEKITNGK